MSVEPATPYTSQRRLNSRVLLPIRPCQGHNRPVWVRMLGSAAGGGFPQWNCGCPNCDGLRRGTIKAAARTQASIAFSADRHNWFLIHASPDIREQIEGFSPLHPRGARDTPIAGIFLTNGDLDQSLGLLSLREAQPLHLYATDRVQEGLTQGNVVYRTLLRTPGQVTWHSLTLLADEELLSLPDGSPSGLAITAFPIPGKLPLHLEGTMSSDPHDNIGLLIHDLDSKRTLAYLPCVGEESALVRATTEKADRVIFDGTFWTDDELITLELGDRRAHQMAHWPLSGPTGSLRMLSDLKRQECVLIHINNTNPILNEQSPERRLVESAGITVAYDGMELVI